MLIGVNDGGDERAILRYAESDAKMIAEVFSDIGGIEKSDSILLLNPTLSTIKRSLDRLTKRIMSDGDKTRTELVFYYSGHSTEEGLLIRDDLYSYLTLKQDLENTTADVKIGILDSCSSGAFTLLKGGKHSAAFLVDESIKTTGHAFITSSAEDESAQESNTLQASFFTHFLVSALRGAADTSLDGKVSLHEAYSYASNETLARTETTQAGAQHASYDFRLSGSGDIVLTDLRNAESSLELADEDFGRFFIRDREDNLISEVNKKYGSSLRISVPSSTYTVIKEVDGIYYKQQITLYVGDSKPLTLNNYKEFTPEKNVIRGGKSNQIEYDLNVPEATAVFGWSTMDNIRELRSDINLFSKAGSLNGFQIALGSMVINDAFGAQISALFNVNGGDLSGLQLSGLFNTTGGNIENYGVQISGLYNWISNGSDSVTLQSSGLFNHIGSDTEGNVVQLSGLNNFIGGNSHGFNIQLTGLYNRSKNTSGIQLAGLFNMSKNMNGLQISSLFNSGEQFKGIQVSSLYNSADNVYGAQISLVNKADYVYGTQIGLININKDIKGLSIGLINISTDGIKNFNYRYNDTTKEQFIDYQFGSSILYHLLYVGLPKDLQNIETFSIGAGLGLHIPLGSLYTEADFSLNNRLLYTKNNIEYLRSHPNLSLKLALPLWDDFAIFAGINFEFEDIFSNNTLNNTYLDDIEIAEHSFFIGFRI
nr:caspase family protein [Thiospirochaeta perfilievii]